jgi:hypothetical protein
LVDGVAPSDGPGAQWSVRAGGTVIGHPVIDAIGYLAAGLVLATFCMRSMGALRSLAVASNIAFISYGYLGGFPPVLLLHVLLLPINTYMLLQLCASTKTRPFCPGSARRRGVASKSPTPPWRVTREADERAIPRRR